MAVLLVCGSVYVMVPAGVAITRPGRTPGTARVPFAVPARQSEYETQARLSTGPDGAFDGAFDRVLAGRSGESAAAAGLAAPAAAATTAAVRSVLRDGCSALCMDE